MLLKGMLAWLLTNSIAKLEFRQASSSFLKQLSIESIMSCLSSIPLINDWSFSQLPGRSDPKPVKEEWKAIEKIPTSVHVELLKRGEIADPYKGLAEHEVQVRGLCLIRYGFTDGMGTLTRAHFAVGRRGRLGFQDDFHTQRRAALLSKPRHRLLWLRYHMYRPTQRQTHPLCLQHVYLLPSLPPGPPGSKRLPF